jgi:hypothetical protein
MNLPEILNQRNPSKAQVKYAEKALKAKDR